MRRRGGARSCGSGGVAIEAAWARPSQIAAEQVSRNIAAVAELAGDVDAQAVDVIQHLLPRAADAMQAAH